MVSQRVILCRGCQHWQGMKWVKVLLRFQSQKGEGQFGISVVGIGSPWSRLALGKEVNRHDHSVGDRIGQARDLESLGFVEGVIECGRWFYPRGSWDQLWFRQLHGEWIETYRCWWQQHDSEIVALVQGVGQKTSARVVSTHSGFRVRIGRVWGDSLLSKQIVSDCKMIY